MRSDKSGWPTCAMLAYGTFGGGHPAAHRYHVRSAVALAGFVAWMMFGAAARSLLPTGAIPIISALVPGATFAYIAWEFRRYLISIDELARSVQFESIAWTYLTGLAVAAIFGGIGLVTQWSVNPLWFIVLEPIRAAWLYIVSRRY
jgi:hypothetical protein